MIDEGMEYESAREMLMALKMELRSAGMLTEAMEKAIDLGKDALKKQNYMANSIRTSCEMAEKSFENNDQLAFNYFRSRELAFTEALVNEAPQLEKRILVDCLYEQWYKEKKGELNK